MSVQRGPDITYLVPGVPKYWFKYSWIFRFILTFLHEWHYSKVGTIIVGHPVATLWPPIFSWENSYSEKQEGDIACDFIAKQWNVIVSHNNKARQHYYCPAQSRWVSLSVTTETTGRGRQCCAVPGSPAVFAPRIWLCSGGPHAATRRGGQSYLQNLVKLCLRIVVNRCKCRIISFHAHFRINSQLKMSKFGRIPDDTGR